MPRPERDDRGAATVLVVAFLGLLLLLGAALGVVGAMVRAHRTAQSAADLAALAAAAALADGHDACAAAAEVAAANDTRVLTCTPLGVDVRLTVEAAGPRWLGQAADLTAEARAGPVSEVGVVP